MPAPALSISEAAPLLRRAVPADVMGLRVLPRIAVARGTAPVGLGPGLLGAIVVSGLLSDASRTLAGPGDVVGDPLTWTACTAAELAVIGAAFADRTTAWPGAIGAVLACARTFPAERVPGGAVDERLLELLWRLAGQWGVTAGDGMLLPLALEARWLAWLMRSGESEVAAALVTLHEDGSATRKRNGWQLASRSGSRSAELRARTALQLATSRQVVGDSVTLSDQAEAALAISRRRQAARDSPSDD
jgi:hypothetical protein